MAHRTRDGKDVSGDPTKLAKLAQSFAVPDDGDIPEQRCKPNAKEGVRLPQHCASAIKAKIAAQDWCGALVDAKGVFGRCLAKGVHAADLYK